MDWDDEDEKTTIFERSEDDAVRLLRSAPPPRGTPMPPPAYAPSPTVPPARIAQARVPKFSGATMPAMPRVGSTRPVVGPLGQASASPFTEPRSSVGSKSVLFAIVSLLIVGLAAAVAILFLPKTGTLVVTVAGPGNKPIDVFQVLINGKDRCHASPCRVPNLDTGTHLVRVVAPGYQQTADQAVKVDAGEDAVLNIVLSHASEGTGIKVAAEGSGLTLHVDGREVGPLPVEIKDMTPGEHSLKITDKNDRYETFEKVVTVEPDKMFRVEPRMKVKRGLAVIRAGENAADAKVLLVSGNERRPIPNLPIKIDISMDKSYSLVATKPGYEEYTQNITFEDGQAEKTFVVSLTPGLDGKADKVADKTDKADTKAVSAPEPARRVSAPRSRPSRRVAATRPAATSEESDSEEASAGASETLANGLLNITSTPPSTVVLDGKPLGATPRTGLSVAPGPHTLLFVHPDFGRKSRSIMVQAGKATTANVNFP